MDKKTRERIGPDYKRIYSDLIELKHPEKKEKCKAILSKEQLSSIDIIKINGIIFGYTTENISINQRHRSYDKETIQQILDYQKNNNLSDIQVADHFMISRNTVAKWKKYSFK
jgi:hypothetical protein